jgi:hypothetical protein
MYLHGDLLDIRNLIYHELLASQPRVAIQLDYGSPGFTLHRHIKIREPRCAKLPVFVLSRVCRAVHTELWPQWLSGTTFIYKLIDDCSDTKFQVGATFGSMRGLVIPEGLNQLCNLIIMPRSDSYYCDIAMAHEIYDAWISRRLRSGPLTDQSLQDLVQIWLRQMKGEAPSSTLVRDRYTDESSHEGCDFSGEQLTFQKAVHCLPEPDCMTIR